MRQDGDVCIFATIVAEDFKSCGCAIVDVFHAQKVKLSNGGRLWAVAHNYLILFA